MAEHQGMPDGEERTIEALLRAAGPRPEPPGSIADEVRAAVTAEWRLRAASRSRRRYAVMSTLAAGVGAVAIATWLMRPTGAPAPQPVASLERSEAVLEARSVGGEWQALQAGDSIMAPGELRSGRDGGAALRLASGVDLRLDGGTRVALTDANHANLIEGAVYIDSGAPGEPAGRDLVIETPHGTVRHLGTRYQVRLDGDRLSVSIREGRISVNAPRGSYTGAAGEQLLLSPSGVERRAITAYSPEWDWVAGISPPFDIEGRSVEEFLAWAASETGRSISFASPAARELARETRLRGSIEGLEPGEALEAVLATTRLDPELSDGRIEIGLRD
jgi:ferric-dicitrate binding protein FerR (iron transport regulator)